MQLEVRPHGDMRLRARPPVESARLVVLSSAFMFCVALYFLLPGDALPMLGWQYYGGGGEFQKIHPATYLTIVVFSLLIAVDRTFRRRCLAQLMSDYAFVAFAIAATATSFVAIVVRGASIANLAETFALALIVRLAIVAIPRKPMIQFRTFVDVLFFVGAASVFFEFAFKRSLIFENPVFYDPNTGQTIVTEFRAAGIFGHPLSAAGFFSLYAILNFVSTPMRLSFGCATRLFLAGLAFVAVLPTGGRSSLLAGALIMTVYLAVSVLRALAKGSFSKAGLVWFVALLTCMVFSLPVMERFDVFNVMLARFSHDDGSTLSREYALQLVLSQRLEDLWLGFDLEYVLNLQRRFRLVAIENAWMNFALVCGLIVTIPLFVSYLLLLFRSNPRYCTSGIYYTALFQLILSNATNDLWAKNPGFATTLAIVFSFLRKDLVVTAPAIRQYRGSQGRLSLPALSGDRISQGSAIGVQSS